MSKRRDGRGVKRVSDSAVRADSDRDSAHQKVLCDLCGERPARFTTAPATNNRSAEGAVYYNDVLKKSYPIRENYRSKVRAGEALRLCNQCRKLVEVA